MRNIIYTHVKDGVSDDEDEDDGYNYILALNSTSSTLSLKRTIDYLMHL